MKYSSNKNEKKDKDFSELDKLNKTEEKLDENPDEHLDEHLIEGRNSILEAFRSGRTVDKLYIQDGLRDSVISSILREAKKRDAIVNFVSKEKLDVMSPGKKHQGVIAICSAYAYS